MQRIPLGNTRLESSRIAFGTASLHHLSTLRERERLLLTALEHGITHFDTAPYYGFGICEATLAVLAKRDVTVATKVGLYPPGSPEASRTAVLTRKVLGKFMPRLSRPRRDQSVAGARRSLDDSLRRLRRDRVDLLLLHEPDHSCLATDEWQEWIDAERDRVGIFGLAGEVERVLPFVRTGSGFARFIQTRDSMLAREATPLREAGHCPAITYGHLAHRGATPSPSETLARAAREFPGTVLLCSTRRADRIPELVRTCC